MNGHNNIFNATAEVNSRFAVIGAKFDLVIGSAVIATMENNLKKLVQYLERALQIT